MAAGFHVLFNIFMMINIYKICTLKTEYRRILKLEKTSEGINVKLIFSKTNVNTKNLKKHTTLCMRALVKRIRAQGGCLGTKSRRKT